MNEMRVTSLEELKAYAKGQLVALPPFAEGQPFVVRLIRPSLTDMIADGTIPNPLIQSASTLFMKGANKINSSNTQDMKSFVELMEAICTKALVEPTMADIASAGLRLTDEQKSAIMGYVQYGAKALDSFRPQSAHLADTQHVTPISESSIGDFKD